MNNQPTFATGQIVKVRSPKGMLALRVTLIESQILHAYPMRKDKVARIRGEHIFNPASNPLKPLDDTDELLWSQGDWYVVTRRQTKEDRILSMLADRKSYTIGQIHDRVGGFRSDLIDTISQLERSGKIDSHTSRTGTRYLLMP